MRDRLLLLGAALAAFGISLGSGFHFDDYGIFPDPLLASGAWKSLWSFSRTRPLTDLTYWLNFEVFGSDAPGYHGLNLILHLGAVLLAFECLRRLLPERAALAAAAIFAVHPAQAEAVDYIWSRGILLAALFCLAAWLAWLHGKGWSAAAWFAAALLAQPECVAFPAVLLMAGEPHKIARPSRGPLALMLVCGLAALARSVWAAPAALAHGEYFRAEGGAVVRYLRLLVFPYGFTVDPDIWIPPLWAGLLIWAGLLVLGYWAWKRGWTWFLAGLILLLPCVFPAGHLAADSCLYLPLLAFAAAGSVSLARLRPGKATAAAVALVAALVVLSIGRTLVWNNDQALWREAVARAPQKVEPKIQLARSLPAGQALEILATARRQAPQDPRVAAEIGRILLAQGQTSAALDEFTHAVAADPRDALSFNNRGVAFQMLGQTAAARADFERALEIKPGFAEARQNLAKLGAGPSEAR